MEQELIKGARKRRIFLYSHDTFGLGHIRRTLKIANELARSGKASILVACASVKAGSFFAHEGIDFINLPGIVKQSDGSYLPRDLDLGLEELVNLRSDILLSSIKSFNPDIILIDKEPLGVGGELLSALDFAHRTFKDCKIYAGFRDILDGPVALEREWGERDTVRILERYFEGLLIYGESEVYPFVENYQLPESLKAKTRYVGYIDPGSAQLSHEHHTFLPSFINDWPLTLVTAGGGGDGHELMAPFVDLLESHPNLERNFILLTGPFLRGDLARRAWALGERANNVQVIHFMAEPRVLFSKCDQTFCMGGYNSLCEIIAEGGHPFVLGRVKPRMEQRIRAESFEKQGWCEALNSENLRVPELLELLQTQTKRRAKLAFKARGLTQIKELFLGLSSS